MSYGKRKAFVSFGDNGDSHDFYPGVGTTYAVNRAIASAYLLNSARGYLEMVDPVLSGAGSVPPGSSLLTTAKAIGSSVVTQKINQVTSTVNGVQAQLNNTLRSLGNTLTRAQAALFSYAYSLVPAKKKK